jgi:hypothetical protein
MAISQYNTPKEFANYMINNRSKGEYLFPLTPLNKTQGEIDDERGYAQKYGVQEENADEIDRNNPEYKFGEIEYQYNDLLKQIKIVTKS